MLGNNQIAIGEKLQAARLEKKISLRELATKADMSASMLSQIEHGKAFPSVRSIYNIAAALDVPVDYFFPNDNEVSAPAAVAAQMTASDLREAHLNGGTDSTAPDLALHPPETPVVHVASRPTIELKGGVTWSRLTARALV